MALDKGDLEQIGEVVESRVAKVVEPYFNAIQKDFNQAHERLDKLDEKLGRIENFLLEEYR